MADRPADGRQFVVGKDIVVVVSNPLPVRSVPQALTFEVGDWVVPRPDSGLNELAGEVVQVVKLAGFADATLHVRTGGAGMPYVAQARQVIKIQRPAK